MAEPLTHSLYRGCNGRYLLLRCPADFLLYAHAIIGFPLVIKCNTLGCSKQCINTDARRGAGFIFAYV